jgi:hypothetical protein
MYQSPQRSLLNTDVTFPFPHSKILILGKTEQLHFGKVPKQSWGIARGRTPCLEGEL